jgi:acetate kinase
MLVLTVDACSPSVRLELVATAAREVRGSGRLAQPRNSRRLGELLDRLPAPDAVAHRLARGGTRPAIVDDGVCQALREVVGGSRDPAERPMPEALALLNMLRRELPGVPHVACPDSAFSHPRHGLSIGWALRRAVDLLARPDLGLVVAHADDDWSVCAARNGVCVDSAATPGSPARTVDTEDAFVRGLRQHITVAAESLDGIDGLVFTGEAGWGRPEVAKAVCTNLPVPGLAGGLATDRDTDAVISPPGREVPVLAVRSRPELELAELARRVVAGEPTVANPRRIRLDDETRAHT